MTTYTYPGVYIEEVKSQVHTITGVATSITVFIGWANKGPTDRAAIILSWSDFDRLYGGLHKDSYLGYAVQQFFNNGGTMAYVVRLIDTAVATAASTATTTLNSAGTGVLLVSAKDKGAWGNSIEVTTTRRLTEPSRFRLAISYTDRINRNTTETFENLSMEKADSRFIETVVKAGSALVSVNVQGGPPPPNPPDNVTSTKLTGGADGNLLVPPYKQFLTNALQLLDTVDLINLIVVPGETDPKAIADLEVYAKKRRAMVIADARLEDSIDSFPIGPDPGMIANGHNAALFFPWINAADPLDENRVRPFPPSGFIAGIISRIDSSRGVWKASAGIEAGLSGATGVVAKLTDDQNGLLNKYGINCIRSFPIYGIVNWGARTLVGADDIGSEWKYLPVRRMALFLEESLYRGTKWVVFEPNDEPLWSQIRLNLTAFMMSLFRQSAFQGTTPSDAFFVKCDRETTIQDDINKGIVNILVGFAPLKPAEFVVIKISQIAGQLM